MYQRRVRRDELLQVGATGREHVVLLADVNAAGAKGLPKPQLLQATPQGQEEQTVIVQRLDCLARCVDRARIAANGLELLQVLVAITACPARRHGGASAAKDTVSVLEVPSRLFG
jgi:hypothetical protein